MKSLDEASKRLVTAISDAAEVLSPEQRAALAEADRANITAASRALAGGGNMHS